MSSALPETPERPTRVLHVVGSMNMGGVETWLMNVLRNVSRDELAFDFMVHKADAAAYDNELLALGAHRYVCRWPSNPLIYARNFLKVLREHGPYDVVHSHVHHFSGFVLLLAKLAGVPIRIAHSHSAPFPQQGKDKGMRRLYLTGAKRLISSVATSGIAVSEKAAVSLFGSNWKNDERWKVIYCGIDLKPFEVPVDRAEVRRSLGIPTNAFVIGHVGSFVDVKNHSFLVDIFEECKKLDSKAMLLLVGDGKLRREIEHKVERLGLTDDVIFAGLRNDIPRLMKGAMDIFIFPSKYEGLGLALIEAQAAGLPCISSEVIPKEAIISRNCLPLALSLSPQSWVDNISEAIRIPSTKDERLIKFSILNSIMSLKLTYGS